MNGTAIHPLFRDVVAALDFPSPSSRRVALHGDESLPSCFPVSDLAVASIGAACVAVSELVALDHAPPAVDIDRRLASLWFGMSIQPQGWELPSPWDAIAGDYRTRDGWIKLHTNAPHHRAAALSVLRCVPTREAVQQAVTAWDSEALEAAIVAARGCAAVLHTQDAWAQHPQGVAVAAEPLIAWDAAAPVAPSAWRPTRDRPLAGLRVLDLTRVLAGPVATRFLAGYGADVLRIDPPDWDEPAVVPEVNLGKRSARLDLHDAGDRATFARLLATADVLVHGYRADALDNLGYGFAERQALRPGLVDVAVDAYGHTGPWRTRRGFDSLVQFSTGIADAGRRWRGGEVPVSLPVQALDQATGYLMAAAAVAGLVARRRGVGMTHARLSLARTAKLLTDHVGAPSDAPFRKADEHDRDAAIMPTPWGPSQRLKPPAVLDGAPMQWPLPPTALGAHAPVWNAGASP